MTPHRGAARHPLRDLLAPLAADRAAAAADLVREASELLLDWLLRRPAGWGRTAVLRTFLNAELARFRRDQAWRGPVARWLRAIRGVLDLAEQRAETSGRELLVEELGLWLGGEAGLPAEESQGARAAEQAAFSTRGREIDGVLYPRPANLRRENPRALPPYAAWDGEPLAAGDRLPDRRLCAAALLQDAVRGETWVVHGYSDTIACALEEAQKRGLSPHLWLPEGGPDAGGRRMARRLAPTGMRISLCYDAALFDALREADRVWLGAEAIGAGGFIARRGARAVLEEAQRLEVPSALVATSDKLVPGGALELPRWSDEDRWLLWENAPEGVRVHSQAFEIVDLSIPDALATEAGLESPGELFVRAFPLEPGAELEPEP